MKNLIIKYQKVIFPLLDISLNVFNYFFHIYVSWYLIPKNYGVLNSLLSILALLLVSGISFQIYTAREMSENKYSISLMQIIKFGIVFAICICGILFIFSPNLINMTKGSLVSIAVVCMIFVFNSFLSIIRGYFQGVGEFFKLNISFYVEVFSKLAFLFILIPRFQNVETCLLSILFGMLMSSIHGLVSCKHKLNSNKEKFKIDRGLEDKHQSNEFSKSTVYKNIFKNIIFIIIANFFFYYFTSLDMIIVNYYLENQAGIYAVSLKYAQIILFVTLSIITVFVPELNRNKENGKHFTTKILKSVSVILGIGVFILIMYYFFVPNTVELVFGKEYKEAKYYLFFTSIQYFILALLFYTINIEILFNRKKYIWILFFGSIILTSTLIKYHYSLFQIIKIQSILYFMMLLIIALRTVILYNKKLKTDS